VEGHLEKGKNEVKGERGLSMGAGKGHRSGGVRTLEKWEGGHLWKKKQQEPFSQAMEKMRRYTEKKKKWF